MSDTQVPVVLKSWRGSRQVALACAVLIAFAVSRSMPNSPTKIYTTSTAIREDANPLTTAN
jgi:hypothetical protein